MKPNLEIFNESDIAFWNQLFAKIEIQILTDAWNHVKCRTDLRMESLYSSLINKANK